MILIESGNEKQTVMPMHVILKPLHNSGSLDLRTQREFIYCFNTYKCYPVTYGM